MKKFDGGAQRTNVWQPFRLLKGPSKTGSVFPSLPACLEVGSLSLRLRCPPQLKIEDALSGLELVFGLGLGDLRLGLIQLRLAQLHDGT